MKQQHKLLLASILSAASCVSSHAGIAYGSLNNFDVINDTGSTCHGFEIELEGVSSREITYTYDWNHYGTPKIQEDLSDPARPKVLIRYASSKNPDGSWSAYTAVPIRPLAPTDGHACTNPSVNEGCEHFGAGFYGNPSVVRYFWLVDNGSGALVRGPMVNIGTPSFTYAPPIPNQAPAQVQAAIEPPEPAELPEKEFGEATWVKEIKTKSRNARKVKLEDLVSDDPDKEDEKNWKNGEEDEVEVEWRLLQQEFKADDGGANGELVAAPEELPEGDEVITRRYEFFKYVGPVDLETGEAFAEKVADDGIHGVGTKKKDDVEYDLSNTVIVGDYIGAQMAGFDQAAPIGLIDNLQPGDQGESYIERRVVVGGTPPYIASITTGFLPEGMFLDPLEGILSGTPTQSGRFEFTIGVLDSQAIEISKAYVLEVIPGAPVISALELSSIGERSATLKWNTDQAASTQVSINGVLQAVNPALQSAHSIPLTGLTPGTSYQLRAISSNAQGKTSESDVIVLTTLKPNPSDLDSNGCIDLTDLQLLNQAIKTKSKLAKYDLNGDGVVNIADARKLTLSFTNPGGAKCKAN